MFPKAFWAQALCWEMLGTQIWVRPFEKLLVRRGRQTRPALQLALSSHGGGPVIVGTRTEPEELGREDPPQTESVFQAEAIRVAPGALACLFIHETAFETSWGRGLEPSHAPRTPGRGSDPGLAPRGSRLRREADAVTTQDGQGPNRGTERAVEWLTQAPAPFTEAQREAGTRPRSRGTRGLLTLESANGARQMCRDT